MEGPEPSDDINPNIKPEGEGSVYIYKVVSKARAIAADPEVVTRD